MRKDLDSKKEEIEEALKNGVSRTEICRDLGCKYDTLLARLEKWGLSHLKNPAGKGRPKPGKRVSVLKHLNSESTITSYKLKNLLFRDVLKEKKCECCGITEWLGKPAPLELHHVDGDKHNNVIHNLKILCAMCHAQTDNFSGKNVGKYNKG
jgi:transposase-like protein